MSTHNSGAGHTPADQKPKCAVRGLLAPTAMCRYVIVGGVFCGFDGKCKHKVEPPARATTDATRAGGES